MVWRNATITRYLTLLKINVSDQGKPLPSFTELRKAFRALIMQHTDKGGDTQHFQELTEAVREVMKYSLGNPELVKSTEDMDKVLLKILETKTKIDFNTGNVVVHIEDDMVSKWIECFDDYFSLEKKETVQDGFQYRVDDWKAPMSNMEPGSVTVIFYSQSQAGPKFMVQVEVNQNHIQNFLPNTK